VDLNVWPPHCTEASANLKIGETGYGNLNSNEDCMLDGEPVEGWQVDVNGPTSVQIDLQFGDYFAHLLLTDAQLRPIAGGYGVKSLRSTFLAGTYIIWVGADFDDGPYQLSIKQVESPGFGTALTPRRR
jgi:hypothetical protein